jgi:hypothetical protein
MRILENGPCGAEKIGRSFRFFCNFDDSSTFGADAGIDILASSR